MVNYFAVKAVTFPFKLAYLATAIFSFSAAIPVSAATVSLDGTWQAEAVPEARGEVIPAAFTRTIPVPGHWPLMKPAVKDNMSDALWCRTTWEAPTELPPRVTLRIGKASFGTTMFVNGKRAGFFPYNFIASETEIRPFLMPAPKTRSCVVRLGNAWLQNGKGRTMAHSGCDPERFHYYQGITDSVTLLLSGWPAVRRLDLCDEMGLLIQDEYPYWGCHVKPFVDQSLNKGRPPSPYCACDPDTLFPELLAWVRERGMHPSIVFIDLQNETVKDWFDALAHRIQPYDFQRRPIDTGWSVNTIPNSPVECHPYLFCKTKYTLGYIAPGGIGVPFSYGR